MERLLSVKQVAELLNISTAMVYQLVRRRRIPFISIGRTYRFSPELIQRWLEASAEGPVDTDASRAPQQSKARKPRTKARKARARGRKKKV